MTKFSIASKMNISGFHSVNKIVVDYPIKNISIVHHFTKIIVDYSTKIIFPSWLLLFKNYI